MAAMRPSRRLTPSFYCSCIWPTAAHCTASRRARYHWPDGVHPLMAHHSSSSHLAVLRHATLPVRRAIDKCRLTGFAGSASRTAVPAARREKEAEEGHAGPILVPVHVPLYISVPLSHISPHNFFS